AVKDAKEKPAEKRKGKKPEEKVTPAETAEAIEKEVTKEISVDIKLTKESITATEAFEDTVQANIPLATKEQEKQVISAQVKKPKKKVKKIKEEAAPAEIAEVVEQEKVEETSFDMKLKKESKKAKKPKEKVAPAETAAVVEQEMIEETSFDIQLKKESVDATEAYEDTVQAKIPLVTKQEQEQAVPVEEEKPKKKAKKPKEKVAPAETAEVVEQEMIEETSFDIQLKKESVDATEETKIPLTTKEQEEEVVSAEEKKPKKKAKKPKEKVAPAETAEVVEQEMIEETSFEIQLKKESVDATEAFEDAVQAKIPLVTKEEEEQAVPVEEEKPKKKAKKPKEKVAPAETAEVVEQEIIEETSLDIQLKKESVDATEETKIPLTTKEQEEEVVSAEEKKPKKKAKKPKEKVAPAETAEVVEQEMIEETSFDIQLKKESVDATEETKIPLTAKEQEEEVISAEEKKPKKKAKKPKETAEVVEEEMIGETSFDIQLRKESADATEAFEDAVQAKIPLVTKEEEEQAVPVEEEKPKKKAKKPKEKVAPAETAEVVEQEMIEETSFDVQLKEESAGATEAFKDTVQVKIPLPARAQEEQAIAVEEQVKEFGKEEAIVAESSELMQQEMAGKKKKNIPKALFIPAEINSRFGDKSILLSETSITTQVTSREASAEIEKVTSPRKPQSATISMKIDSAKRSKSRGRTPSSATEFSFTQQSGSERGDTGEVVETTVRKPRDRSGLPPLPKEKVQGETIITRKESAEEAEISCHRTSESEVVGLSIRATVKKEVKTEHGKKKSQKKSSVAEEMVAFEEIEFTASLVPAEQSASKVIFEAKERLSSEGFLESVSRKRKSKTLEKPELPSTIKPDKQEALEEVPAEKRPIKKPAENYQEVEISAEYSCGTSDKLSSFSVALPVVDAAACTIKEPLAKKSKKKRPSIAEKKDHLEKKPKEVKETVEQMGLTIEGIKDVIEEAELFSEFENDFSTATSEFSLRESASEADSISVREPTQKKLKKKKTSAAEKKLSVSEGDKKSEKKEEPLVEKQKKDEQVPAKDEAKKRRKETAQKTSETSEDSAIAVSSLADDATSLSIREEGEKADDKTGKVEKKEKVKKRKSAIEKSVEEQSEEFEVSAQFTTKVKEDEEGKMVDTDVAFTVVQKVASEETLIGELQEATESTISSTTTSRRSSALSTDEGFAVPRRQRKRREGFVSLPNQKYQALRGDTARIECELFNEEDDVIWQINGKPISDDSRCVEESDGYMRTLFVTKLTPADTGTVISMRIGEHYSETVLIVEETAVEIKDRLPQRSVGTADNDLNLSVTLSHEAQNVNWFFNGQPIEESDSVVINTEKDVTTLTIKNATFDHAGRYSVSADGAETSTVVEIRGKPVVDGAELAKIVELETQENLSFTIPFKANPEPTVECLFEGKPLTREQRILTEVLNDTVIVSKRKLTKRDAGEYTVKIANEFGEVLQTFNLAIRIPCTDTPEMPEEVRVKEVGPDSITVAWNAPNNDGGSEITGYVIEKKEAGRRAFHTVAKISTAKTEHVIEELEANTSYEIRLSAINKYGVGEFTEPIEACTGTPFQKPVIENAPTLVDITDKTVFVRRYAITDLEVGPTYEFKVEAYNEAGLQSDSNVASETLTLSAALLRPKKQVNVPRIVITGPDSVSVDWDEPDVDEDGITSYTIHYRSEGSSLWSEVECEHPPKNIDSLREGVAYIFKIAPVNAVGVGEFSEETSPVLVVGEKEPEITKGIKNVSVPCKRELRLECHAMAEPSPQYIWYKDGEEIIPADENVEIINEGYMSALIIHKTATTDEGKYMCEVVNKLGSQKSSAKVTITEVRAHFEASFPEFTETVEGQDVTLCCQLSDADASVVWYRNGKKIKPNERITIGEDDTERKLTIVNVTPKDSGDYECATIDDRSKARGELLVREEEPHIKEGPQDQTISMLGERVILTCEATKPIKGMVRWYKNGQEIWPQRHKMTMSTTDNIATLEIENFDARDIGEYYIMLSDDERSAPAKIELKVAPDIQLAKDFEQEVVLNAGKDFTISFTFTAYPPPKVEFIHNEKPLELERARLEIYDDSASVRLRNMRRSDSGTLKIVVENEHGTVTKDVHISVADVPSEPRNLSVSNVSANSVLLEWLPPLENNGSPLIEYIVERKMAETGRWRHLAKVKADIESFLADELFSDELYVFRVCAVNEVGEGAPSKTVDVITKDEAEAVQEEIPEKLVDTVLLHTPGKPQVALIENTKVQISWENVINTESYDIERNTLSEALWLHIANTDQTTFIDRSIVKSDQYTYRIIAKCDERKSEPGEPSEPLNINLPETVDEEQPEQKKPVKKKSKKKVDEKVPDKAEEVTVEEATVEEEKTKQEEEKVSEIDTTVSPPDLKTEQADETETAEPELVDQKPKEKLEEKKPEKKKVKKKKVDEKSSEEQEKPPAEAPTVEEQKTAQKALEVDAAVHPHVEEEMLKTEKQEKMAEVKSEAVDEGQKEQLEGKPEKKKVKKKKVEEKTVKTKEKEEGKQELVPEKLEEEPKAVEEPKAADKPKEKLEVQDKPKEEHKASEEPKEEAKAPEEPKQKEEAAKAEEAKPERVKKDKKKVTELKVTSEKTKLQLTLHSKAELRAQIEGDFDSCTWTKDKKPIPEHSTKTTKTESTYQIESANESSSGTYTCTVANKTTKSSVDFDVSVIGKKPMVEFEGKTIEAKVGETLKVSANVTGLPQPQLSWKKDSVALKTIENAVMAHKDGVASITVKKCVLENSGVYTLCAENEFGKNEAQITVKVKVSKLSKYMLECLRQVKEVQCYLKFAGVPSVPVGPLNVSNITATSCTLSWQPPKNDGNSKLLGYCVEKRDMKRSAWAFHARTSETSAEISGLTETTKYHFRVTAENALGNGPALETEKPIELKKPDEKPKSAPSKPVAKETTNNSITVQWGPVTDSGDVLYNVEMKDSKSKRGWTLVNKRPIHETEITAEKLIKNSVYEFRVTAVNEAGSGPTSEPSDGIECVERKEAQKPTFTKAPEDEIGCEQKKIKIIAEFTGEPTPEVQWFKGDSEIYPGNRQWIEASETVSVLTIGGLREDDQDQYKVVLKNKKGKAEHHFKLTVDSPPQITRPEKYANAQLYNQGEEVKLRLTFSGWQFLVFSFQEKSFVKLFRWHLHEII
ncbi:unnamed protein product, partial [Toxocara canis]|uniref:non-specific serine/threonine protein kinase n=1 Tax=Toxocara canis TaxID=6265 RepID=A0A183UT64_TOXCA